MVRAKTRHLRGRSAVVETAESTTSGHEDVGSSSGTGATDIMEDRIVDKLFAKLRDSGLLSVPPMQLHTDGTYTTAVSRPRQ